MKWNKLVLCISSAVTVIAISCSRNNEEVKPKSKIYEHTIVVFYSNENLKSDTMLVRSPRGATRGTWAAFNLHTWTGEGAVASRLNYISRAGDIGTQLASGARSYNVIKTEIF